MATKNDNTAVLETTESKESKEVSESKEVKEAAESKEAAEGKEVAERKEGYMYRESNNKRSWEKRYFILRENKIDYFQEQGDQKAEGTINLTEGKGVREKDQCTCKWPSAAVEDFCFGLATKSQTWYFYTTSDEGKVGDWKRLIQGIIDEVGIPDPDWKKDREGKPEGPFSFLARKLASFGAMFTKKAMESAPVDDKVKDGVSAGADAAKAQADADPNASPAERAALAAKGGAGIVKGVSGNEDVAMAATVVEHGADMAKDQIKADPDASMTERLALGVKGGAGLVKDVTGDDDIAKVAGVVGAGADVVKDQAKAGPEASMTERLAMGVKGGAGVLGAAVDDDTVKDVTSAVGSVAGEVAKTAKKENKENN